METVLGWKRYWGGNPVPGSHTVNKSHHDPVRSSQYSTTGVTKAMVCVILYIG